MNNVCVTPNNIENAKKLINNVDVLLLNLKNFSCRSNYYYNLNEIIKLNEIKEKTKIFVIINNFIFDNQIDELEKTIIALNKINIDAIIFNDYAIAQIVYEQKLNIKLIYNPSTLFTSFGQYDFFQENNISGLTLSNELFSYEIDEIAQKKPNNIELCMQVFGLSLLMHSRWNLVSNFQKYTNDYESFEPNKLLIIKELNKVYPNYIYENEYGTHMFTGYCLCLLKYISKIIEWKIDYLIIDTFLIENKNADLIISKIYMDALKDKKNIIDYNVIQNDINYELSTGFIGGINEIKHTFKINE